ncbi:hypothetical protein DPMN_042664 [Dreissena polymorpha]|uniref:Uncharacterized protein n=1 Tax=Dreissena polymorpha TaxID=45954 RepID=A0A9D4HX84_DREPO|nr:hypothetical protein DPMN_042664 [Dreissena polymorpha]
MLVDAGRLPGGWESKAVNGISVDEEHFQVDGERRTVYGHVGDTGTLSECEGFLQHRLGRYRNASYGGRYLSVERLFQNLHGTRRGQQGVVRGECALATTPL